MSDGTTGSNKPLIESIAQELNLCPWTQLFPIQEVRDINKLLQ